MNAGLLLIALVAVLAPVMSRSLAAWVRIPVLVFELILGIIVGPAMLGWVVPDEVLTVLADFGLGLLFFVAGSEIDFAGIRGRPLARASLGWLVSLGLGFAIGFIVAGGEAAIIIAICLSSTALGTLLPILRDAGELHTPFGRAVSAVGAIGEFGPLVAISLFLSTRRPLGAALVLIGFVVVAGGVVLYALYGRHGWLHRAVQATLHTSTQYAVRVLVLILVGLAVLSIALELDMLLGAFAAGVIWRLLMRNAGDEEREQVETKVEALAFGVFVPIFFIYTGITFDLQALFADWRVLVLVPIFLVLLLITRGLPAIAAAPAGATRRDRLSLGLLGATGLPIIVAATSTALDHGFIGPGMAAALVGAGMLSVLIYPLIAMALRGEREPEEAVEFLTDG
ncbi:MAG: cation:proton antiporter [Chloroflexota bacterium]|nr:cation:proton antiporter [Chloroflexota bacterium]